MGDILPTKPCVAYGLLWPGDSCRLPACPINSLYKCRYGRFFFISGHVTEKITSNFKILNHFTAFICGPMFSEFSALLPLSIHYNCAVALFSTWGHLAQKLG